MSGALPRGSSSPAGAMQSPGVMDDSRSPFFLTGAPATVRTSAVAATDVGRTGEGLVSATEEANEQLKRRLTSQQYDVGGHSLKLDGINQSGSIVLSVRLADDGSCAPWTDVIAERLEHQSHATSRSPLQSTHHLLSTNLPEYDDLPSPVAAPAPSPLAPSSQAHQTPTGTPTRAAATPTTLSWIALPSGGASPTPLGQAYATQPMAPSAFDRVSDRPTTPPRASIAGPGSPAAAAVSAQLNAIRLPMRTHSTASSAAASTALASRPGLASEAQRVQSETSQAMYSHAAQAAELSHAAVKRMVAAAVVAVKRAHGECPTPALSVPSAPDAEPCGDHAPGASDGHGPFRNYPIEPNEGAYSICILVVGTRGDVQPFIAICRELRRFGHRVRLATHSPYRQFVEENGVEFYPLGGDPTILSEFVVRNRGILPGGGSKGFMSDIREQEEQMKQIVWSTWPACTEADPLRPSRPFRATAIIANPPTISMVVCAEKLQVPLHMMFTMPWTPTKEFPHPMAVVQSINVAGAISALPNDFISGAANYYSYRAVDLYLWMGFMPVMEEFRKHLQLPPYPMTSTGPAHAISGLRLPFTYLWSPSLQPRPKDWGIHTAVTGFVFLDEESTPYTPPSDLAAFLDPAKEPPIYIGFGSLVLQDPKGTTKIVYEAARKSGKRILLSRGWADLGSGVPGRPDNVCIVGNCPHSWLLPKCSAAIHHGGAGTTAAALRCGLPTLVVPFFGDQPFWGDCCLRAGVGPRPVPIGRLTTKDLLAAFATFDKPEVREKATAVAENMAKENGLQDAVYHFHQCLDEHRRIIGEGSYRLQKPEYKDVSMADLAGRTSRSVTKVSSGVYEAVEATLEAVAAEMRRAIDLTSHTVKATASIVVSNAMAPVSRPSKESKGGGKGDSRGGLGGHRSASKGSSNGAAAGASVGGGGAGGAASNAPTHRRRRRRKWWSILVCGACGANVQGDDVTNAHITATTPAPAKHTAAQSEPVRADQIGSVHSGSLKVPVDDAAAQVFQSSADSATAATATARTAHEAAISQPSTGAVAPEPAGSEAPVVAGGARAKPHENGGATASASSQNTQQDVVDITAGQRHVFAASGARDETQQQQAGHAVVSHNGGASAPDWAGNNGTKGRNGPGRTLSGPVAQMAGGAPVDVGA